MRIAVGAMMQETDTFSHLRTRLADFTRAHGDEVYGVKAWKHNVISGALETLRAGGADVVPTSFSRAIAGALVKQEVFEQIRTEIVTGVVDAGPLDGICLVLHGSMCAENYDDPEGALLEALRKEVGWDIPIVCSLDMHATITEKMIACANGFFGYRTAPHVDEYETGAKAADMLIASIRSGKKLITRMKKLPILIAGEQAESGESPFRELLEGLRSADLEPGVLGTTYSIGYPWADSVHSGVAALVTGYEDCAEQLDRLAARLAGDFDAVKTRFSFASEAHPLEAAIEIALRESSGPIVISDSGDNPTAGASQDLAIAARALIKQKAVNSIVIAIADQGSYEKCKCAGVGAKAELALGRLDPYVVTPPSPLHILAEVKLVASAGNTDYAVVECEGVTIVISRGRVRVAEPFDVQELGIRLEDYRIIVVKCGYLGPEYKAIAAGSILALTPGYTCELIETLPYQKIPRPIFPLDR